ncbi:AlpA family transcriptional regulator [uncultured Massilia sp.]|uniref:helix-turn-helix transcriptional regulator n=1 Tax=uncultured Massilia sp. TaxID=169973 RepID=UPI0025F5A5E4|nr:AlpA family phage regulatory protein [uncultured Massilia sp.]
MLRLPTVKDRVSLGRSSIYAAIKRGEFPAPVRLSERAVAWVESDIDAWLASRIEASRKGVHV